MAKYSSLKSTLDEIIKTNTSRSITGDVLNQQLDNIINALGMGFQYMGIATTSMNPGTPDSNVAYLAKTAGTYTNFGGLVLASGEVAFLKFDGTWAKDTIVALSEKQDVIADLSEIRSGATAGASAYQKPGSGIPKTDLDAEVQSSLRKADSALQEHQDISGKQDVIQSINISITEDGGSPSGVASVSGSTLNITLKNIEGAIGSTPNITIGTVTTLPAGSQATATLTGTAAAPVLNLGIPVGATGAQGVQGNTGSSVEYPFELVDNLETDDNTKALTARQGKVLDEKISQLGLKVPELASSQLGRKVFKIDIQNGTAANAANANAVRTQTFPVEAGHYYRVHTTRPVTDGNIYVVGYEFYDTDVTYVAGSSYAHVSRTGYAMEYGVRGTIIPVIARDGAIRMSFNFVEYNPTAGTYVALRTTSFANYGVYIEDISGISANDYLKSSTPLVSDQLCPFEYGNWTATTSSFTYNASGTRLRLAIGKTIHLKQGQKVGFKDYTNIRYYLAWNLDSTPKNSGGWQTSDYTIAEEGDYQILISYRTETYILDYQSVLSMFFIKDAAPNADKEDISHLFWPKMMNLSRQGSNSLYIDNQTRLSIAENLYADSDLYIQSDSGYQFAVQYRNADGSFISDKGWATSFVVPSGTYFTLTFSHTTTTEKVGENECVHLHFGRNGFISESSKGDDYLDKVYNISRNSPIQAAAHRGLSTFAPENTMSAFRAARDAGFACIETDVQFTSDRVLVLLHDSSIDRTSDGSGNVIDMTYDDLLAYDFGSWFSSEFAGEKIPTFEEYLLFCKGSGIKPYVELKLNSAELADACVAKALECGMMDEIHWLSFYPLPLTTVVGRYPKADVCYVTSTTFTADNISSLTTILSSLKTDYNEVFLGASNYNEVMINACESLLVKMSQWTVDSATAIINIPSYLSSVTSKLLNVSKVQNYIARNHPTLLLNS